VNISLLIQHKSFIDIFIKNITMQKIFYWTWIKLHVQMTSVIKEAKPPRFDFEEKDEKTTYYQI